jgi:2-dehydro-3-deoxyphosphogluconate aldolase/(4S)-4-hydroxy-2-oxoglutarate aldolase
VTPEELRRGPVAAAIREHRLIAVLRRIEPQAQLVALVDELVGAGVRAFEITFDSPSAAADLTALRGRLERSVLVGAGTILTTGQLMSAHAAGADFAVAPVVDPDLTHIAVDHGLPFISGGFSPTEIHAAWLAGATFVKLFPASVAGPAMVRELRGPLPEIELIPTGGVDSSNAKAFLEAGAAAVGIGSALTRANSAGRHMMVQTILGR